MTRNRGGFLGRGGGLIALLLFWAFWLGADEPYPWPEGGPLFENIFEMNDPLFRAFDKVYQEGGGTVARSSQGAFSGGLSMLCTIPGNTSERFAAIHHRVESPINELFLRAYLRLNDDFTLGATEGHAVTVLSANYWNGSLVRVLLRSDSTGTIRLGLSTGDGGTTPLLKQRWYCVELRYRRGSGDGLAQVWLDGQLEVSSLGQVFPHASDQYNLGFCYLDSGSSAEIRGSACFDDLVVDDQPIGVQPRSIRLIHPDFRSRVGAPVYAILTGHQESDRLVATLSSSVGLDRTVLDRQGLSSGRIDFELDLSGLPAATYTLTVRLLGAGGGERARATRTFGKSYDGDPVYSIDARNNMVYKGQRFFPVTSFGAGISTYQDWKDKRYANILFGNSWNTDMGPEEYRQALDAAQAAGFSLIGPAVDGRFDEKGLPQWQVNDVADYINRLKDHPANVGWIWREEPENFGYDAASQKAWWDKVKELDPRRPMEQVFMAESYLPRAHAGWGRVMKGYHWPYLVGDIYSADWYPIEHPEHPYTDFLDATDASRIWNMDLVPFFPWVQTADLLSGEGGGTPTPVDIRSMCWLSVIHGAKGLHWYPWQGGVPAENWAAKTRFVDEITELTEVVLSPEASLPLTCQTSGGERVDHTLRVLGNRVYLFAGNTTMEHTDLTVDLGFAAPVVTVYGEGRTLSAASGRFTDSFGPRAVHIYVLSDGAGRMDLLSPNGGERWRRGEVRAITWTATGILGDLVIELLQGQTVLGTIAPSVPASAGRFSWTVGRLADGSWVTGNGMGIRLRSTEGRVLAERTL